MKLKRELFERTMTLKYQLRVDDDDTFLKKCIDDYFKEVGDLLPCMMQDVIVDNEYDLECVEMWLDTVLDLL